MEQQSDITYIAIVVIYIIAVGWYVTSALLSKKKEGSTSSSGSHSSSSPSSSSSSSSSSHRHRRGRRCPKCRQIIDARRTLCQHCGNEFPIDPNSEPHPDEVRSGRRSPTQSPPGDAKTAVG